MAANEHNISDRTGGIISNSNHKIKANVLSVSSQQ
jgi:hypothetical protein